MDTKIIEVSLDAEIKKREAEIEVLKRAQAKAQKVKQLKAEVAALEKEIKLDLEPTGQPVEIEPMEQKADEAASADKKRRAKSHKPVIRIEEMALAIRAEVCAAEAKQPYAEWLSVSGSGAHKRYRVWVGKFSEAEGFDRLNTQWDCKVLRHFSCMVEDVVVKSKKINMACWEKDANGVVIRDRSREHKIGLRRKTKQVKQVVYSSVWIVLKPGLEKQEWNVLQKAIYGLRAELDKADHIKWFAKWAHDTKLPVGRRKVATPLLLETVWDMYCSEFLPARRTTATVDAAVIAHTSNTVSTARAARRAV